MVLSDLGGPDTSCILFFTYVKWENNTYLLLRDVSLTSFYEAQASCGMSAKYYSIYFYELSVLLQ